MDSLLDKALAVRTKKAKYLDVVTQQHAELLMAWLRGEISYQSAGRAIGLPASGAGHYLAAMLRACYAQGLISVTLTKAKKAAR